MGKSLIIQGADFSLNGFKYTEVKKTITDLYNLQGEKIVDWAVQMASISNGVYYYEAANAVFGKGSNVRDIASTLLIDVEDYTIAKVHTMCDIPPQGLVLGCATMLFLDVNQKVIGGYSTASVGATNVISTGVGVIRNMTDFSKEIPSGCKYIVCTVSGTNTPTLFNQFKLELSGFLVS